MQMLPLVFCFNEKRYMRAFRSHPQRKKSRAYHFRIHQQHIASNFECSIWRVD